MSDTYDVLILNETLKKEEKCRETFRTESMFMKQPRNPMNGQVSQGEEPFVVPFHHSLMLRLEEQRSPYKAPPEARRMHPLLDQRESTFMRASPMMEVVRRRMDTPMLQTLRDRQRSMAGEVEQMQVLAALKKEMLESSLRAGGSARFGGCGREDKVLG